LFRRLEVLCKILFDLLSFIIVAYSSNSIILLIKYLLNLARRCDILYITSVLFGINLVLICNYFLSLLLEIWLMLENRGRNPHVSRIAFGSSKGKSFFVPSVEVGWYIS
jgi:hypothetical protein